MNKFTNYIFVASIVIFSFIFFQKCINHTDGEQNSLSLVLEDKIESFDPAKAFNDVVLTLIGQSYESLYQYHYLKRPYEIIPLLAEELPEALNGGLAYKIKLKKDIVYHDHPAFHGKRRTVVAQDFLNQIKRIAFNPVKSNGKWLFAGKLKGFNEFSNKVGDNIELFFNETISGFKIIDDYTFVLELVKKESIFINFLTMSFVVPIPLEVITYEKNNLDNVIVGTGPYYLDSHTKSEFNFKKFSSFRKEYYPSVGDRYANLEDLISSSNEVIPFIDEIKFTVEEDPVKLLDDFKNKKYDFISIPKEFIYDFTANFGSLPKEYKEQEIQLKHFASLSSDWLSFNMRDPVWKKNAKLRKAIGYVIDYDEYLKIISNGTNMRANSLYSPGVPGYSPSSQLPFKYDLNKARELLKEAGFPEGKGLPEFVYSTRSNGAVHIQVAEFFQKQFKKIGINLRIDVLSFAEFLEKGRAGKLQIFLDRWIYDYPDAENIIQLLLTKNHPGINKSGYSEKEIDGWYEEYITNSNEDTKLKMMQKIEKKLIEDSPWIMLSYYSSYILHQKQIKNLRKSSFIRNYLKYIKIVN